MLEKSFHGWLAGVYGSVLNGEGRDGDILLTPWREVAIPLVEFVESATSMKMLKSEAGLMAHSYLMMDRDGRIFDLRWTYPYSPRYQ